MAAPNSLPDTPDALPSPTRLSVMFGGTLAQSAGINQMLANILYAWRKLGITASGESTPGESQVLKGNADGSSIWDERGAPPLIQNGGQEVWGTSTSVTVTSAATDTPTLPGWVSRREHASDTLVVTQETSIIDGTGKSSTRLVKTNANGLASHRVNLPVATVNEWRGRTVTIKARVRQGVASNTRVSINDGSLTSGSTVVTTGAFATLTVTRTVSTSATAIWLGVEIGVSSNAADTVYVDNITVAWGSVPANYVPPAQPPVVPACRVYNAGANTLTTAVALALTFASEVYDNDGIHSTSVNTERLTCQTDGIYRAFASIQFAANATGVRQVSIRKNGTTDMVAHSANANSAGAHTIALGTEVTLAVGDYLTCLAFQTSGGGLNVIASDGPGVQYDFGMSYVGPA